MTAAWYQGIIGGFVVPSALRGPRAAEAAISQAIVGLREALDIDTSVTSGRASPV